MKIFTTGPGRWRGRMRLKAGIVLCAVLSALFAFGAFRVGSAPAVSPREVLCRRQVLPSPRLPALRLASASQRRREHPCKGEGERVARPSPCKGSGADPQALKCLSERHV